MSPQGFPEADVRKGLKKSFPNVTFVYNPAYEKKCMLE